MLKASFVPESFSARLDRKFVPLQVLDNETKERDANRFIQRYNGGYSKGALRQTAHEEEAMGHRQHPRAMRQA